MHNLEVQPGRDNFMQFHATLLNYLGSSEVPDCEWANRNIAFHICAACIRQDNPG